MRDEDKYVNDCFLRWNMVKVLKEVRCEGFGYLEERMMVGWKVLLRRGYVSFLKGEENFSW